MKLIVGLGNPGRRYARSRHNAGFLALDALVRDLRLSWSKDQRRHAEFARGAVSGVRILLLKPLTFMNLSGTAVRAFLSARKIKHEDLLLVHDEMDLEPGRLSFKLGGSSAGHHGVASVYEHLGASEVARLRIGIGRPPRSDKEEWVLGQMERETKEATKRAVSAVKDWVVSDLTSAINRWNAAPPQSNPPLGSRGG